MLKESSQLIDGSLFVGQPILEPFLDDGASSPSVTSPYVIAMPSNDFIANRVPFFYARN